MRRGKVSSEDGMMDGSYSIAVPSNRSVSQAGRLKLPEDTGSCWDKLGICGQLINPNAKTSVGRKIQMFQVIFFALLALAGIVVQVITDAESGDAREARAKNIKKPLQMTADMYSLAASLAHEARLVFETIDADYDDFLSVAQTAIRNTDTKLLWITAWPSQEQFAKLPPAIRANISSISALGNSLRAQRNLRKVENATTELDALNYYYTIIHSLSSLAAEITLKMDRFPGWNEKLAYHHLFEMDIYAQILYTIGYKFRLEERVVDMNDPVYQTMFEAGIFYEQLIHLIALDSQYSREQLATNYTQQDTIRQFSTNYHLILEMNYDNKELLSPEEFKEVSEYTLLALEWLKKTIMARVVEFANVEVNQWQISEIVSVILFTIAGIISIIGIFAHQHGMHGLQKQVIETNTRAETLNKAMTVLYDFVPRVMINMVKQGDPMFPRRSQDLCVVFFDINTSALMEELQPAEFLELLTDYFSLLEESLIKYHCFKIDVIGDAFCLGAGAGEPHAVDHVSEMVFMALELQDRVSEIIIRESSETALRLRIGIHVGPGVSNILYLQVPRMCIFGEAIEIAALIHATSLPLRVQTSSAIYERLMNLPDIEFNKRGLLTMEGANNIVVYWATWADDDEALDAERMSRASTPSIGFKEDGAKLD